MVWKITSVNVPSDITMKSRKQVKRKTNDEIPEDFCDKPKREYNHDKVQDVLREDASTRGFTYDGPYDPPKGDIFSREAWPHYDPPVDKECCSCVTRSDVLLILFGIVFLFGMACTGLFAIQDHPIKIVKYGEFNQDTGNYDTKYKQVMQNDFYLFPGLGGLVIGAIGMIMIWANKDDW